MFLMEQIYVVLPLIVLVDLRTGVEKMRLVMSSVFASVGEIELEGKSELGSKIICEDRNRF